MKIIQTNAIIWSPPPRLNPSVDELFLNGFRELLAVKDNEEDALCAIKKVGSSREAQILTGLSEMCSGLENLF